MTTKKVTTKSTEKKFVKNSSSKKITAKKNVVKKVATKKAAVKRTVVKKNTSVKKDTESQKQAEFFSGEYFYAVGRRKTSVAQVRLYKVTENSKQGDLINGKNAKDFFEEDRTQKKLFSPLEISGMRDTFILSIIVRGGGVTGQVEAARHGIARALVTFDETLRPVLKAEGFMRRDPRKVERKKPGLKKARRATQWRKR